MGTQTALIFGAMKFDSWEFLEELRISHPTVICADGGIHCAQSAGFIPDFYIGDGDSGGSPAEGIPSQVLPNKKDYSDLQAACELALKLGFQQIVLTGCTGGRQDHHISALQLLELISLRGCEGKIIDPRNEIFFLSPSHKVIKKGRFKYFSLLPIDKEITVTISGAMYDLDHRQVLRGDSLCISNEFYQDVVTLNLHDGNCFLVFSR